MTATTGVPTFDDAHRRSAADVAAAVDVDPDAGLPSAEAAVRLERYGPNELPTEPPPSVWVVGRGQLSNPMNIMLLIVAVASLAIGQVATGIVVAALVTFNVVMGTNQEMKARASVDALAKMQIPQARVRRDGQVAEVASPGARSRRRRPARGGRPRPGRRAHRHVGHARGAGGGAHRRERTGAKDADHARRQRGRARRSHRHGVPEHAGHPGIGGLSRDRHRRGHPDGPHRRHGDGDQADAVAVAAGARRHDQGLRLPRVGRRRHHRRSSASLADRTARRSRCCASRPRSRRSPSVCRRSCRRCCRRVRSTSPRRRRS